MWRSIRQAFADCSKIFGRCGGFSQFIVEDLEHLVHEENYMDDPDQQHEPEPLMDDETEEYREPFQYRPYVLKFGKCFPGIVELLQKALAELGVVNVLDVMYKDVEDYFVMDEEEREYEDEEEDWKDANFQFIFEHGSRA